MLATLSRRNEPRPFDATRNVNDITSSATPAGMAFTGSQTALRTGTGGAEQSLFSSRSNGPFSPPAVERAQYGFNHASAPQEPLPRIDNIMNRRADMNSSLYQICLTLKRRLAEVPGFDRYILEMEQDERDGNDATDPVTSMWNMLRRGLPLMDVYNALQPRVRLEVNHSRITEAKVGKAATFKFLQACLEELKFPANECFLITDLYGSDTTGFVKVTKVVNRVLDILSGHGVLLHSEPRHGNNRDEEPQKRSHKQNVIDELVTSERDYVQHLETLQQFKNQVEQTGAIPGDAVHDIFLNLNALLDFQRRFLIRIEQQNSLEEASQNWGQLFVQYQDSFKVYEPFIANQKRCTAIVCESWAKLRTAAISPAVQGMVATESVLLGFLMKPFQRLTKYPMLLSDLRKKGGLDEEKQQDLLEGETAASSVLVRANEAIAKEERQIAVDELLGRVEDWKGHDITHFGELLLYGSHTVLKGEGQKEVEREVRVISDALDPFPRFSLQTAITVPALTPIPEPRKTLYTKETGSQNETPIKKVRRTDLGYKCKKVEPMRKPERKSKLEGSQTSREKLKPEGLQDPVGNLRPCTFQKPEGNQKLGVTRKPVAHREPSQNPETKIESSPERQSTHVGNSPAFPPPPTRPPPPPPLSAKPSSLSQIDETCSIIDILAEDPAQYFPFAPWTSNNKGHSASNVATPRMSPLTKLFNKLKRSPSLTLSGNYGDHPSTSSLTRGTNESTVSPRFRSRFPKLMSELAPSTGLGSKVATASLSLASLFSRARVRLKKWGYRPPTPSPKNRKVNEKLTDDRKDTLTKLVRKACKLPKYLRVRRRRLLDLNENRFLFSFNRPLVNKTKFLYVRYEEETRPLHKAEKLAENAIANHEGQLVHLQIQYKVYLFERILLCCKETNPNKPKNRLGNNKSLIDKKGKPRLQLKGRIFMQNVTDVVSFSKHGSYYIQIFWKGDPGVENFVIRFVNEETMSKWRSKVEAQRVALSDSARSSGQTGTSETEFLYIKNQAALQNPYKQEYDGEEEDEITPNPAAHTGSLSEFDMSRNTSSTSLRSRSTTGGSGPSPGQGTSRVAPPRFPIPDHGHGSNAPLTLSTNFAAGSPLVDEHIGDSYFSPLADSPVSTRSSTQTSMFPFPRQQISNLGWTAEEHKHNTAPAIGRAPSRDGQTPVNAYTMNGRTVLRPSLPAMAASQTAHQLSLTQSRSRSASTPDIHNPNGLAARRYANGQPLIDIVPVPPIPAHISAMRAPINRSQTNSPTGSQMPPRTGNQSPQLSRDRGPVSSVQRSETRQYPALLSGGLSGLGQRQINPAFAPTSGNERIPSVTQLKVKIYFDPEPSHVTIVVPIIIKHRSLIDRIDSKMERVSSLSIAKGTAKLRYCDSDNEMVTMGCDEDVGEAIDEWTKLHRDELDAGIVPDIELYWSKA